MGKPLSTFFAEEERLEAERLGPERDKAARAARLKRTKEVLRSCRCPDCRSVLEILEEGDRDA
jgi:hypothetical protein